MSHHDSYLPVYYAMLDFAASAHVRDNRLVMILLDEIQGKRKIAIESDSEVGKRIELNAIVAAAKDAANQEERFSTVVSAVLSLLTEEEYNDEDVQGLLSTLKIQAVLDCVRGPRVIDWKAFHDSINEFFPEVDENEDPNGYVDRQSLLDVYKSKEKIRVNKLLRDHSVKDAVLKVTEFCNAYEKQHLSRPKLKTVLSGKKDYVQTLGEDGQIQLESASGSLLKTLQTSVSALKKSEIKDPLEYAATSAAAAIESPHVRSSHVTPSRLTPSRAKSPVKASSSRQTPTSVVKPFTKQSTPTSRAKSPERASPKKKSIVNGPSTGVEMHFTDDEIEAEEEVGRATLPSHRKRTIEALNRSNVSSELDDGGKRKKKRTRNFWREEETQLLLRAVRVHGKSWKAIVDDYPAFGEWGRSQVDLKDRYRNLEKQGKTTGIDEDI